MKLQGLAILYFSLLILNATYLYIAWEGKEVILQARLKADQTSSYDETFYREVVRHYHTRGIFLGDTLTEVLLAEGSYAGWFIFAPLASLALACLYGRAVSPRWRWLSVGAALITAIPVLFANPTLTQLAGILD